MNWATLQRTLHRRWLILIKPIREAWADPQSLLRYIGYLTFMGLMFYAYALVTNLLTIPLSGDYVLQQIPFYLNGYDDWTHFFRTGEFVLWDDSTYLGANHIGSNSFYYYLNPFFMPILLFPRGLVPQGLALLMIGKMVGASLTFRLFLKYFQVKENHARIFAMAYGFSGWMAYYLWFNHFMEVAVVFPLVLLGVEKLLKEKNLRFLVLSLFLMGITNYFFLVSTSFTAVFYAIFRFLQTASKRSWLDHLKVAGLGVVAFALGIMMSAYVFLPSVMVAITSNRVGEAWYLDQLVAAFEAENWQELWSLITIWRNQGGVEEPYNQFYPLISFLFPTVSNRSSTLFNTGSYDNTISSLFVYTPLTLLLIPSLIHNYMKKKWSHFLGLGLILFMLFTPITYQLVHGFTIDYGRWQIFVVTILITYIAINFEERMKFKQWYYDVSFAVIISLSVYAILVAIANENKFFFTEMNERQYVAIFAVVYMIAVYLYLRQSFRKKSLPEMMQTAIFFEAIVMGTLIMNMHGLISYPNRIDNGLDLIRDQREIVKQIQNQDDQFFRIYNLNAGESTNLGMRLGYNGMTVFHSLYNFYLSDFNNYSHLNYNYRGWSMGYHEKRYNLDTFLGVKYYIMQNVYDSYTKASEPNPETGVFDYLYQNVPHGFIKSSTLSTNKNSVYVNQNFIEGGFTYDTLYPNNQVEGQFSNSYFTNSTTEVLYNEEAYLNGVILANEDIEAILTDAPHLQTSEAPTRSIARINTNVQLIRCEDNEGNALIFNPSHVARLETCEATPVASNNSINQFDGEYLPFHITPTTGSNFGNEPDDYFFALQLRLSHYATVYFFDEQGDIIIRDAHSFVNTSFKFMRGYYPTRPVARIVIVPKFSEGNMYYPVLFRETYAAHLQRLANLQAYPLEGFKHTANSRRFSTNFDTARMIVLNTPFDPGWKVTRIQAGGVKDTTPVYLSQGGFVGFLSGVGPTEYRVTYWTPYLTEGLLIALSGFAIFGGVIGASYLVDKKRTEKEKNL
ncbi:MAG: YfhO family protein [Firmicutes bacterium]|nr:YfhO family protein [Bacillota bacterium]